MSEDNDEDDDDKLRARFLELRRNDRRHLAAPPFLSMWQKQRSAPSPWRVIVPVVSSLAAAAMLVVYCGIQSISSSAPPVAISPPASVIGGEPAVLTTRGGGRLYDPLPLDFLLETSSVSVSSSSVSRPLRGW